MTTGSHRGPPTIGPRAYQAGSAISFDVPQSLIKAADYASVYGSRLLGFQTWHDQGQENYVQRNLRWGWVPDSGISSSATDISSFYGYLPSHANNVTVIYFCSDGLQDGSIDLELKQGGVSLGTESLSVTGGYNWIATREAGLSKRNHFPLKVTKDLDSSGAWGEITVEMSVTTGSNDPIIALRHAVCFWGV